MVGAKSAAIFIDTLGSVGLFRHPMLIGTQFIFLSVACGRFNVSGLKRVSVPTTFQQDDESDGGNGGSGGNNDGGGGSSQPGSGGATSGGFQFRFVGSPERISAQGFEIPVYPSAEVVDNGETYELPLTGRGIRQKRVIFVDVDVYLAASYVVREHLPLRDTPLRKIQESPFEVMQLTFVRNVSGSDIQNSLRESLTANGVDTNRPGIQSIFQQFSGGILSGQTFLILSRQRRNENHESVIIATPAGSHTVSGDNLGGDLWRAWFGTPADDGLSRLRSRLIGE